MKQVIDWFEIPVSDISRAQAFYEAVLQTTLHRESFGGPNIEMVVFKEDGLRAKGALMAGNPTVTVGASGTLVYMHAGKSLDAALQRVVAAGGQVAMAKVALPDGVGFMAHMLDMDGNRVGLHAYA